MSKEPQDTRRRILERARVLFNAHGIDNVGVRDLARDLEMSPGNLSYHFTRKEDLVRALMDELRERNGARPEPARVERVSELVEGLRASLLAQLDYRCLVEAIGHVTRTWPELGAAYRETEQRRRQALAATLGHLIRRGALRPDTSEHQVAMLVATWSLVARYWLSERGLSYPDVSDAEAVGHYVGLMAHSLVPYVCAEEAQALRPFLDGVLVERALGRPASRPLGENT